uniref:WWE domain-containing protein n=1 Tax=Rhizophora mucronata TaxID=61149 RepID=A0A2P2LM51_RHIMU
MESKIPKVLSMSGLKRKRPSARYPEAYLDGEASDLVSPEWSPSSVDPSLLTAVVDLGGKRRRLDGGRGKRMYSGNRSRLRSYSIFVKTKVPQRFMFYNNGEWVDFPESVLGLVKNEFQVKKGAVLEVEFDGHRYLLDFLHMLRVDLETGLQKPIAWIDEAGNCFFPEIFTVEDDDDDDDYDNDEDNEQDKSYPNFCEGLPNGPHEIKVHIELDLKGADQSKQIQLSQNSLGAVEIEDSAVQSDDDAVVEEELDPGIVQQMFLLGMSIRRGVDIIDVYRCSSDSQEARLKLFEKQIELTRIYRGDANVRCAWLAVPRDALSTIMQYGLGHCGPYAAKSNTGVRLSPANCCYTR